MNFILLRNHKEECNSRCLINAPVNYIVSFRIQENIAYLEKIAYHCKSALSTEQIKQTKTKKNMFMEKKIFNFLLNFIISTSIF